MKSTRTIRSSAVVLGVALLSATCAGLALATLLVVPFTQSDPGKLPPFVFVARRNFPNNLVVPGFGPVGRTIVRSGRLLVRERDGRIRSLLPDSTLYDVSDPAVSWDARHIAFSGLDRKGGSWRIWIVNADGTGLRPVTRSERQLDLSPLGPSAASLFERYDDFDPCWLPDGRLVFASTRFPQLSQQGRFLVSNLFVVNTDGTGLERITSERNGAEEPTIDATGRIVYARWFFNPYLASDSLTSGLTTERAIAAASDTVDHWQLVSIFPDGDRIELAAGQLGAHRREGGYQPTILRDGTILAVSPAPGSLAPLPENLALTDFGRTLGAAPKPVGPQTFLLVSPAALPDGRVLFSWSHASITVPNERGSFRIGVLSLDGKKPPVDLMMQVNGDQLDAVPLVKRKVPPILPPQGGVDDPAWTLPVTTIDQVRRMDDTFRFDCLNVYLTGPVDSPFPDAPRIAKGAKIRFFAALARPEAATGDTVVLIRESKLEASGAVHESDIPGDVPLFEQLVDENGRIMRSAHGPAHVPGMNFSRIGSGTKCVGCHEGHSALPVPKNNFEAKWFNASPSAAVTVSSGTGGPELVDRRAKGTMGWVAEAAEGQWARLTWSLAVEARSIVLYAIHLDGSDRTSLQVRECQLIFYRDGREVGRVTAGRVRPEGTRIDFPSVRLDAIEVRPTRVSGTVDGRPTVALAEIETIARMIE